MNVVDAVGFPVLFFTAIVAVPVVVMFMQLAATALRSEEPVNLGSAISAQEKSLANSSFAVLMPAHNEAVGIAASINAVRAQLGANDRLLVVADNCTDATADIARAAGAEVTERTDASRRGKGYALDHGVRWLERAPPAAVVIIDADCIAAADALECLVKRCLATSRPVQALYLMNAPPGSGLGLRIAAFAWVIKNHLRPLGGAALGWPCQLMGTGMAFPWALIRSAPLASGHLVEDMELGVALASAGAAPLFCPAALVTSVFPSDADGARAQRTRWEHGQLSVLAKTGPRLLARAFARRDGALAAMALDLMVPPLAALALALVCALTVAAAWWSFSADVHPLALAAVATALFGAGVMAAWWRGGRQLVSLRELLALPLYVAAKVPIYVRLFTKRQVEWVRTKRDDGQH